MLNPLSETLDFDNEAQLLFAKLNLLPSESGGRFNSLDAIWRHPTTKGTIYVGNQSAAMSKELLNKFGITKIVNCTDNMNNFHENAGEFKGDGVPSSAYTLRAGNKEKAGASPYHTSITPNAPSTITNLQNTNFKYLRFPISFWSRFVDQRTTDNHTSLLNFLMPLFKFVDEALANGENVLVHCLAGAHRAGTTGVLCLMRYSGENDVAVAIKTAKKLRPIIDPIGMLPELLKRYSLARNDGVDLDKGWH